jgi:surface protein
MFSNANVFNQPIGTWNTSSATDMNNMFRDGTPSFNQDVSNWNVSNVTNMSAMFKGASSFNNGGSPNINNWNVSNVTNMWIMFSDATVFNQPLSNWNVAKVTSLGGMFQRARAFNQNIGSWNTIKVNDISFMFFQANAFNNDGSSTINNWNTAAVTTMQQTFSFAFAFNQPIGNWNTNNVTSIYAMFWVASSFNQDIGSWNVSQCTNFQSTFGGAASFNNGGSPSINNWNVSNVTSLQDAFGNTAAFQQPLNNWNVSNVTNMSYTFKGSGFNQNITSWNTGKVTTMLQMFMNASAFNQNLGNWNIDKVTNMVDMFNGVCLSTANYNGILNGWAAQPLREPNVSFHGGYSYHTAAGTAGKTALAGTGWSIIDGGLNTSLVLTSAPGTNNQTAAVNMPITTITYSFPGTAGVNMTGLPTGVTASVSGGVLTISGTPTVIGAYTYSAGCGGLTGTINVTCSVGAASSTPSLCIYTPLTAIKHSTIGITGIDSIAGLPPGVTATWSSDTITISGTPTTAGTFNYVVFNKSCSNSKATGTITVIMLPNVISAVTNASCAGFTDGAIDLSVDGTGPFSFIWSPGGATTEDLSGITDGSYTVTVTGASGCSTVTSGIVVGTSGTLLSVCQDNDGDTYGNPSVSTTYCSVNSTINPTSLVVDGSFENQAVLQNLPGYVPPSAPTEVWGAGWNNWGWTSWQDIAGNGAWTGGAIARTEEYAAGWKRAHSGNVFGIIKDNGSMTQTFTATSSGVGTLNWYDANRASWREHDWFGRPNTYSVTITDNFGNVQQLGTYTSIVAGGTNYSSPLPLGGYGWWTTQAKNFWFARTSSDFTLVAGTTYTLTYNSLTVNDDRTTFLDDISISTRALSTLPAGYVANCSDCNDLSAAVNPGAAEECNGIDDDCDGTADNGLTFLSYYADSDGDGYGTGAPTVSCIQLPNTATNDLDCDDLNIDVNPGVQEICANLIDDNCNLIIDEGCGCANVPTSNAGFDQSICGNSNVNLLGAIGGSATAATWTTSGTGTFTPNANALNAVYIPSAADRTSGLVTLTLTTNAVLPCEPAIDQIDITFSNPPAGTGAISGITSLCYPTPGTPYTYSVPAVLGATSYTWTVPAGTTIVSGQGTNTIVLSWTITAIHNGLFGTLSVQADNSNSCGLSAPSSTMLSIQLTAPVTPPSISGPLKVCPGDGVQTFSVAPVARATSYTWTVPSGLTLLTGQGTNIITASINPGFVGGNVTVTANNVCGISPVRIRALFLNNLPAAASIIGMTNGVCNQSNVPYSISAPIAGAVSYAWSIPANTSIASTSPSGDAITLNYLPGFTSGTLSVVGINNCGNGTARAITVTGAPGTPGVISGPTSLCFGITNMYSVSVVSGTTSYNWLTSSTTILPIQPSSGPGIGQGFKNVEIKGAILASNQIVAVNASNSCGTSRNQNLTGVNVVTCLRMGDPTSTFDLVAYPNPTSDLLTVDFNSSSEQDYRISLMDATGRVVRSDVKDALEGQNKIQFSLKGLAAGIYMLQFQMNNSSEQLRIIVQ